ncbi:hypothetical protein IGL98_003343 [Enterococcus sp. DIV0840]|uniref:InlB B-repeat-containing protein n=1 Tax=unclassified Enterococcus TaxID=2608891 RepID=UPI001A8E6E4C|nr:InlB B-repeat-containing protein [Enterococcus sp. DIV0849a]MBO0433091.1 InlB B-repeat-containing protein [Enterococcus sp. DIV0849a]
MKFKNRVTICMAVLMLMSQTTVPGIVSAEGIRETYTTDSTVESNETLESSGEQGSLKQNTDIVPKVRSITTESSNKEHQPENKGVEQRFSLALEEQSTPITMESDFNLKIKGTISTGVLELPEGISFNTEKNKNADGGLNQNLAYNQEKRELTIKNISEAQDFKLNLIADQVGTYKLILQDIDKTVKSNELEVAVSEKAPSTNQEASKKTNERSEINPNETVVAPTLTATTSKEETSDVDERLQFSGSLTYTDATTNLNNTTITVEVENGTIQTYTKIADSTWFKTVKYDRDANTVTYTLKNGYTSGNFVNMAVTVLPKVGIGLDENIKTSYTINGTNSNGDPFETVVNSASTKFTGDPFALVTPNSKSWDFSGVGVNVTAYQGETQEIYPRLTRSKTLKESFKNARIILTVSDPEFKDMLTFKEGRGTTYDNNGTIQNASKKLTELSDTQTEMAFGEINANQVSVFYWGGGLRISNDAEIDKTYSYSYEIYDGDELIYSTAPSTVKIVPAGNQVKFTQASPKESQITSEFNYALGYTSQGSGEVSNFETVYQIPDGVDVTRVSSGRIDLTQNAIQKVEYLLGNQWIEVTEKSDEATYSFENISGEIKKVKITQANNATARNIQPDRIYMKNRDNKIGDTIQLKVESISFTDALSENISLDTANYTANYTIIGNDEQLTGGALFEQATTAAFDAITVLNGDIFKYNYRLGLSQGKLEQPYIFVKVPKGMSVKNTDNTIQIPNGGSVTYRQAPVSGTTVQPISQAENTGSFETSDKKSVIYYYKADNTTLRYFDKTEMLFIANQYKAENLSSGLYEVEVGMGSLTQEIDTMNVNGTGYGKKTLSAELKQGLGVNISSYYSKTTAFTVGEVDKIETDVKVKGSADADYVNATKGEIANVVPGQKIDYDITLTNKGTNEYKNFEVVNILPYVGDTLVGSNVPRGSQFQVNPDASGIHVFYNGEQTNDTTLLTSTSSTPERFSVPSGSYVSGDPFQSSNEITRVRSLNLTLPGITVKPGDTVQLKYTTNVPLDAKRPPKGSSEVISANNSLAYKVTKTTQAGDVTLAGEPVVAVAKTTPAAEDGILSGQIYLDLNKDGSLSASEPELNKVQLELFKKEGTDFISTGAKSESAADGTGKAGTFGFVDLAHNTYKIKVSLPDVEGAEFITTGDNGLEKIDDKTAWLKQSGQTELIISPTTNIITDLKVALYIPTPLSGKIIFTDKNDVIKTTEYGSGYTVALRDATAKVIETTIAGAEGSYSFEGLDISKPGDYTLEFTAPSGKKFVFNEKMNGQAGGTLAINLTPGIGKDATDISDIYITDADTPIGSVDLEGAIGTKGNVNPSGAKITATDDTTEATFVWTILDRLGKVSYSGSSMGELDRAIGLLISDGNYGKYTIDLVVTDDAGNGNASPIKTDFIVASKPTIAITNPTITFTTIDTVDEATVLAKAVATTTTYPAGLTTTLTSNTATVIPDSKVQGSYAVMVTATDELGLVSFPSVITVEIEDAKVNVSYMVEGTERSKSEVVYNKTITKPKDPVKNGYKFTGWAKEDNSIWNFATDVAPATDFTLTAQFKAEDQTISFDMDGGSPKQEDIVAATDSVVDLDGLAKPTKAGYQFIGWFNGETQVSGTIAMPVGGLSLVAKWTGEDQVIIFDSDKGTGVDSIVLPTGAELDLNDAVTTRVGYTFKGWYVGNEKYEGIITVPASGLSLVAKWSAENQVITFDSSKGTALEPIVLPTDSELNLNDAVTTRAGYTFEGWYVGNKQYEGTITVPAGGLSLVAKWTAEDQEITFDSGKGTALEPIVLPTDSEVNLNDAVSTREGYTFAGWYVGDKQYEGTITMPAGGLSLVAKWTGEDQEITFDSGEGTPVEPIVLPAGAELNMSEVITTRAGYAFAGWYANDKKYEGVITVPVGGLSLVAEWAVEDQTIRFDVNGGDPETKPTDIIQPTDSQVTLKGITTPVREAFAFAGWLDENGKVMEESFIMPACGMVLKAQWIDLIADGTWKLEADNFKIALSDLKKLDTANKLNTAILAASKAQVVNANKEVVVAGKDLLVDTSAVKANVGGEQKVTISYAPKTYEETEASLSTKATSAQTTSDEVPEASTVTKTIVMSVDDDVTKSNDDENQDGTNIDENSKDNNKKSDVISNDKKSTKRSDKQSKLPKAGETKSFLTWLVGLTMVMSGSVLLWFRKRNIQD